jgi:dipeptidyl aminopeptidase/acylaminoacyl peptidase
MRKLFALLLALLTFAPALTPLAQAKGDEINYASLSAVKDDQLTITYSSPGTDETFRCSLTADCEKVTDSTTNPSLPTINGIPAEVSPLGNYGVTQTIVGVPNQTAFYTLYDLSESKPRVITILPYQQPASAIEFSNNENAVLIFGYDGTVVRYDIDSAGSARTIINQTDRPFLSISPDGRYLSAYNYVAKAHRIWDLTTGKLITVPSGEPSYVVYDDNKNQAAALTDNNGFPNLIQIDLSTGATKPINPGTYTVTDYAWLDGELYYIANQDDPLLWNVYRYKAATGEHNKIAERALYESTFRTLAGKLLFTQIDGKNANLTVYDPTDKELTTIEPVGASPAEDTISRQSIEIANLHAALLTPKKANKNHNLFIWLHGGPMRQTSVYYHPYLSYAVYDELLERLAAGGNTVLKLDYHGSYGYGDAFQNSLTGALGVIDSNDVAAVIKAMQDKYDIDHVYLIGNSYGGYLGLKETVDHPELVDGVISINGVTDWTSLVRRIPSSPFKTYFGGIPDPTTILSYLDASIVTKIPAIGKQPILVIYGEEDTEVPPRQSTEFASLAQVLDKNITLVSLPGEEHVIRERANLDNICEQIKSTFDLDTVECD